MNSLDPREKDIQSICNGILSMSIESTGDYGSGGQCPFCLTDCSWNAGMDDFKHAPDCIYLIAKDLVTGFKEA